MHVFAYVKGTLDYKIIYSLETSTGLNPIGYVNANYAGDLVETGHSTGAYIFMMAGGAVSWSSKWQATVALLTTEAEYMATTRMCQQSVWMHSFMDKVGLSQQRPGSLHNNNNSSISITTSTKGHKQAKHIQV